MMKDRSFIFLAGLHRSGTSLLHEIIREHPDISGFKDTGVPEDEGQHLQSVYKAARAYGGPGKFVFDRRSYMDNFHPLATTENANAIFKQWSRYLDLSCKYIIEKSPPNIIRTRFFQELFPNSKFVIILRHPLAVSYATKKWCTSPIEDLLDHSILAYELFFSDIKHLNSVYVLRYEDFVSDPSKYFFEIMEFLGLVRINVHHTVQPDANDKYFEMWENQKKHVDGRIIQSLEARAKKIGYSVENYNCLLPPPWIGAKPHV